MFFDTVVDGNGCEEEGFPVVVSIEVSPSSSVSDRVATSEANNPKFGSKWIKKRRE